MLRMTNFKFLIKLLMLIACISMSIHKVNATTNDDTTQNIPQPIIVEDWKSIPFIYLTDPIVPKLARFASEEIKRGSLDKTVFAQKQDVENGAIYILTLELVDAHQLHHMYSVQIFVPNDDGLWKVIYYVPTKR